MNYQIYTPENIFLHVNATTFIVLYGIVLYCILQLRNIHATVAIKFIIPHPLISQACSKNDVDFSLRASVKNNDRRTRFASNYN